MEANFVDWLDFPDPISLPYVSSLPEVSVDLNQFDAISHKNPEDRHEVNETPKQTDLISTDSKFHVPLFGLDDESISMWSIQSYKIDRLLSKKSLKSIPLDKPTQINALPIQTPNMIEFSSIQPHQPPKPTPKNVDNDIKTKHYSKSSRLSIEDHKKWWQLQNSPNQSTNHQLDQFLQHVAAEQSFYLQSLKEMIISIHGPLYKMYPQHVSEILEPYLNHLKQQRLDTYHRYYTQSDSNSSFRAYFDPRNQIQNKFVLKKEKLLKFVGKAFELKSIPQKKPLKQTIKPIDNLWILNEAKKDDKNAETVFLKKTMPVISQDSNIHEILAESSHHIHAAFSSSTITTLLDASTSEDFSIPIKIEKQRFGSTEANPDLKTIFFDKPLLKQEMSAKDKNQKYYKTLLKQFLLQGQNSFNCSTQNTESRSITESQTKIEESIVNNHHIDPDVESGPDNLMYNQFSLGNFQVLIRTRVDGLFKLDQHQQNVIHPPATQANHADHQNPANRTLSSSLHKHASVVSKLKYVPGHQLEEFSASEKTTYLLKMLLLGDSCVFVGHFDPNSSTLLQCEIVSKESLKMPSNKLENMFSTLHDIIEWCASLSVGEYLLTHQSQAKKLEIHQLYQTKDQIQFADGKVSTIHDLKQWQTLAGKTQTDSIPYLPPRWDFNRINQIPNTFPPQSYHCCFDFVRSGICKHPMSCQHIHITQAEAEAKHIPTPFSSATSPSKRNSNTFNKADSSMANQPKALDENTKKKKRKRSKSSSNPNKKPCLSSVDK